LKIDKLESEVLSSNLVAQLNKVFLLKNKKGVLTRGQLYKIPDSNNKADNNPQVSVTFFSLILWIKQNFGDQVMKSSNLETQ
jgi:hypothetical protein